MQAPIFNSLGSNYSISFIKLALKQIFSPKVSAIDELKYFLHRKFDGQVHLFYKGRDAIEFSIKSLDLEKNDQVLIQAFSCHAIQEAISKAGAKPVFMDIEKNNLNPGINNLRQAFKKSKRPKAVLIQHTLGTPANIKKIHKFCKKHDLILIEDLAQGLGGKDKDDKPLGTHADIIILSFGRDKIVDGLAGGAAIFKTLQPRKSIKIKQSVPRNIVLKDLLYPAASYAIRKTYHFCCVGKLLHFILTKIGFFYSPVKNMSKNLSALPASYAPLILYQFRRLEINLKKRKQIAKTYYKTFKHDHILKKVICHQNSQQTNHGSNLRFWFCIKNPLELTKFLAEDKIYLADRWYRKPVDCGGLKCVNHYEKGSCPIVEQYSSQIMNLPTHQYISSTDVARIINNIKAWLTIQ